jgi:hypothetical protein
MDDEVEEPFEYQQYFVGECTCDHDRDEHGWGSCGIDDCPCEAGWEE